MKDKNRKIISSFCTLSCIMLNVFLSSTNVYAKDRLHGKDRFDTAVEISKEGWKEGSDCIVIANGEKFPDSLSAAPLAKLKNAPLLLTKNDYLKDSVLQEVKRLKPKEIIIVGGSSVVSEKIENNLRELNSVTKLKRLAGKDRYETSLKIAENLGEVKEIALVSGENFPDALSIASISAQRKMPILLVEKNNIKLDTLNYIRNLKNLDNKYIIGGEGVISKENVEKKLDTSKRLCGENRFSTNLAVLEEFKNEILFNKIYVAKGSGSVGNEFADALSGAALAAKNKETVILTGDSITKDIAEFIKKESSPKSEIVLLGGQSVVKDSIRCDIKIEAKELKELNNTNKIKGNISISEQNAKLEGKDIEGNVYIEKEGCYVKNTKIKGILYIKAKGKINLEKVEADKIVILNNEDNTLNIKETKCKKVEVASKYKSKSEINILKGNEIENIIVSSSAILKNEKDNHINIEVVDSSLKNRSLEFKGEFKKDIKIKSHVNIKVDINTNIEKLNVFTNEDEKVTLDGNFKEVVISNKTNIEIKNDSQINSIKSDGSGKKTKIIARDNVKVGEVDKDLEIEGKLEKLNLKYDKSSGNEENQQENGNHNSSEKETNQGENSSDKPSQENKKLKASYEVELSQIKLNVENVKDSMISIKVCDSKGNIEYLNQIDKEKIQEGKTTLAFNVKKEGTYSIKILGNKSQNAKIENIKVSKLAKILKVNDINISINENEKFTLPKTVKAKMSNGKEKEVKIVWDNKEVDTSKKGEYTFEGTVEGYDKEVKLDLQVKELDKIKSLENITVQLEQNDPYNMPNTITAIMNTGVKKEVNVNWNSVLDTSKAGEFVIEGTVEGFQGEVKLIAKIIAMDENEVVKFKNPVFEQIIRDTLYVDGDITRKDLNEIQELEVSSWMGYELNSIEDIYLLKNLKKLHLFGNFIEDIEPLKKLHNLEVLNLGACEAIENIEPLRNLTKLKELKLNGNIINNIEPLVNLTNLEKLNLGGNPIKDFSPTGKYFYNLKEKDFDFKLMKTKGNTIERDIEEGEKFFLPSVVTLGESKRNVAVKWDKNKVNTDIVGKYTFKGEIEGEQYKAIKLILNIKSIDNNKKIAFEDKELEKAIRLAISKPSGAIYRKDVVNLRKLPSLYSVKDLSGIENLQGLEELIIMSTSISDITPISKLKNLKRLELDTVGITSIKSGVFDDLNKLEFLNLAGNGIENISLNAFRGLKNLKEFNLADNKISKIKSGKLFDGLNNLEELTLDGNKFSMTDIEGNQINTIKNDAFRGLKNLKKLNIQGMALDKVDFLENLSNLQWIDMRNNNIRDIKSLENLHKLDELWADHNKIEDLTPFKSLTQIEKLKLNSNEIKDIQPLKDCVNLKSLCIQENSITTLKSLENMVKLEDLEAKQNKIKDIEALSNLVNLNSLYLENNQIEKVNPIANLTKLKILRLSGNKIKDYTPLKNIYNNLKSPDFILKDN